ARLDWGPVGELGPLVIAVQRGEPGEGGDRIADGDAVLRRGAVLGQIQHVHHRVAVMALLVAVLRVEREREVMHAVGPEADALAPRGDSQPRAPGSGERGAVPGALVVDLQRGVGPRFLPRGVTLHRNAGGADGLTLGQIERHIVAGELAVELPRGIEWMVLP